MTSKRVENWVDDISRGDVDLRPIKSSSSHRSICSTDTSFPSSFPRGITSTWFSTLNPVFLKTSQSWHESGAGTRGLRWWHGLPNVSSQLLPKGWALTSRDKGTGKNPMKKMGSSTPVSVQQSSRVRSWDWGCWAARLETSIRNRLWTKRSRPVKKGSKSLSLGQRVWDGRADQSKHGYNLYICLCLDLGYHWAETHIREKHRKAGGTSFLSKKNPSIPRVWPRFFPGGEFDWLGRMWCGRRGPCEQVVNDWDMAVAPMCMHNFWAKICGYSIRMVGLNRKLTLFLHRKELPGGEVGEDRAKTSPRKNTPPHDILVLMYIDTTYTLHICI